MCGEEEASIVYWRNTRFGPLSTYELALVATYNYSYTATSVNSYVVTVHTCRSLLSISDKERPGRLPWEDCVIVKQNKIYIITVSSESHIYCIYNIHK